MCAMFVCVPDASSICQLMENLRYRIRFASSFHSVLLPIEMQAFVATQRFIRYVDCLLQTPYDQFSKRKTAHANDSCGETHRNRRYIIDTRAHTRRLVIYFISLFLRRVYCFCFSEIKKACILTTAPSISSSQSSQSATLPINIILLYKVREMKKINQT